MLIETRHIKRRRIDGVKLALEYSCELAIKRRMNEEFRRAYQFLCENFTHDRFVLMKISLLVIPFGKTVSRHY
jgi:hypothetical protein